MFRDLGLQNTLGNKYALHIRDLQAPPIDHVCQTFRPHGMHSSSQHDIENKHR